MIAEPYYGVMFPTEEFDKDSLTSNYGWIFDFVLIERPCKQVAGMKVNQYELQITERVNERKFDKIIFQVGAKNYDNMVGVVQTVFYSLTTMLSYDLDDYSLDEEIHLKGIRDFIEKILTTSKQEPDAYGFEYFSKPIVYKEPPPPTFHYVQL